MLLKTLKAFGANRTGNVAMLTALTLVPLLATAGGATDIGRLQSAHRRLADAIDAGAVSAVANNSPAMLAAGAGAPDGPIVSGVAQATRLINANILNSPDETIDSLNVDVTKAGSTVTAKVTAQASIKPYFLQLIGINTLHTTAASTAVNSLPTYIDFYLLLDNTPSMGVGATPTDVATMVNHTPDQCAFACHDVSNPNNYYNLAKSLGVTTRIDVLRSATQQLMVTANASETTPGQYKMAINTFGASSATPGFFPLAPPTNDLTLAKTVAGSIDLMAVPYQNFNNDQDTDFNSAMTGANAYIPTPGTGATSTSAQKVLFLVSDGVNDSSVGGSRKISPIDTGLCDTLKNRGVMVAVLYTTYLPLPTNPFYNANVAPFVNNIGPTMQACASPGLYFEVSPTQGISDAMAALFQRAIDKAHLTH